MLLEGRSRCRRWVCTGGPGGMHRTQFPDSLRFSATYKGSASSWERLGLMADEQGNKPWFARVSLVLS